MRVAKHIIGLAVLVMAQLAQAQLGIGENTKLNAGGLLSFGYAGDYGDQIPSNHGVNWGLDGKLSGSYYNPNFLSFTATPYYNQSRADSTYQSLTGASGVSGTANFFTGSNFPGSVTYRYDANSTGTFGLTGQPDFTTHGKGQGFGIGWSALLPGLPTLSVGYSQGSGSATVYGTNQETNSSNKLFNLRSNYQIEGFHLNAFYDHTSFDSKFPEFLAGQQESTSDTSGHDYGFGATHNLPLHGSFYANYSRSSATSDYFSSQGQASNTSSYNDSNENMGASFHPTQKLSLFVNQNYTSNLSGYLNQNFINNGTPTPGVNLGSGSHSTTVGGGAEYQFTRYLSAQTQATHYSQYYFGHSYTGTYVSATVNYSKRVLNLFSFSTSVIESANGQGSNALGFIGNVNYFHRFGRWQTSGNFSYAQNVQTLLVTYTTSYYNYNANLHRRFGHGVQWTAAFNGSHSGLTNHPGSNSHSEGYSTSFGTRIFSLNGNFGQSSGLSLLGSGGLQTPPPTPGLNDFILFSGTTYGGGISATPLRRVVLSGSFSRAISNTSGTAITGSRNNNEIFNAQLQYHLRRIGLQAGYTRFTQGISAAGAPPATTNAFFVGMTRWFDFF
jgi:hypothetical protein